MDFERNEESDGDSSTITASEDSFQYDSSEEESRIPVVFVHELKPSDEKRTAAKELNQHKRSMVWVVECGEKIAEIEPSTSAQIADQETPCLDKPAGRAENRKRTQSSEFWTPHTPRRTPLPLLPWANNQEVWQTMVYKEEATISTRNCRLFENPGNLLPYHRAILIDWIMEICQVYHLRRVTYYLAVDYIDRFFTIKPMVPKNRLQLIAITSLFIAAKVEEVYPPKLAEFVFVCDEACGVNDILNCEMILLNTLDWDLCRMTPTAWLNLYFQIHFDAEKVRDKKMHVEMNHNFLFPQYSTYQFVLASNLIDLFSMDPVFLLFSYSIIAAGAIYYVYGRTAALRISGLQWKDLKDCVEYMAVFYTVLSTSNDPLLSTARECVDCDDCAQEQKSYRHLSADIPDLIATEYHFIQSHVVNLKYFEEATLLRLQKMGFSARKLLLAENDEPSKSSVKKLFDTTDDEESTHVYEFERLPSDNAEYENTANSCDSSDSNSNIFQSKTKYTFQEILEGINESTIKKLTARKSNF